MVVFYKDGYELLGSRKEGQFLTTALYSVNHI
jgi:hypothetical protein